ncbi:MAG TPA: toprim domain-containing protein, partial [Anaerolineae bacterium]|nr:toprim domain-containing protein [Anaerolineae bacterium]
MNDFKAFIERLKEAVHIEDIIAETGNLTLVRNGKYFRTKEHDSLSIDPERGWYEWYAKADTPGARGDVLEWLQHHGGFPDFMEAVRFLSDKTGIRYQWSEEETRRYRVKRRRYDTLTLIANYLAEVLWQDAGATALEYARGRGWDDETIKAARLGYWDWDLAKGLRGHLQMHEVDLSHPAVVSILGYRGNVLSWAEKWEIPRNRIQVDWINSNKVPGAPGGLLIYPHYERGKCVYLSGRKLEWLPESQYPKSWNQRTTFVGGRQVYWNHVAVRDYVVVVEGQGDAVSLGQWGIPAVALAGTKADDNLIAQLRGMKQVYVALDSDAAGRAGMQSLAEALGAGTPVVTWPLGGDANDWLKTGATGKS